MKCDIIADGIVAAARERRPLVVVSAVGGRHLGDAIGFDRLTLRRNGGKGGQAGRDLHLHLHGQGLDAGEGEGGDAGDGHGPAEWPAGAVRSGGAGQFRDRGKEAPL